MEKSAERPPEGQTTSVMPTVYFDGGCPICSREIEVYQRGPGGGAIHWVDVTQCESAELGAGLTREDALARLHMRTRDGQLVSGAAAFTGMWKHLPRWRWLGVAFGRGLRLAALEWAYVGFLRVRKAWRRV